MNSLAQIVQAIATAVNAKMTMTLSQRIAQMSQQMLHSAASSGWIDRTAAGPGVRQARLGRSAERVQQATEQRNDLKGKVDELGEFILNNAKSLSDKDFKKLQRALDVYTNQLDRARSALQKVTESDKKIKDENDRLTRAEKASGERRGGSIRESLKGVYSKFRRGIGSGGRSRIKGIHKRIDAALNPQRARAKATAARSAYKKANQSYYKAKSEHHQAQAEHQKNVELNARAPSAQSAKNVAASESRVQSTGQVIADAGKVLAGSAEAAESMEAMAAGAEALNVVLPGLGVAIAAVGIAVAGAIEFMRRQLAAGVKEVARFKEERSLFSGNVQRAIAEYDLQSINLEQRSTQATSGSATGVIESTMALRESNQGRSEQWEDISNKMLATTLDIATLISNVINELDFITPAAQAAVDLLRSTLSVFGIPLREISKNTAREANVGSFGPLFAGMRGNDAITNRGLKQPPARLPPIK